PALESKCLESDGDCKTTPYNAWNTTQSCRLYPQSDSLACDYYEDSGKRQKGWYGYCLEYDRPPGDPNACLLWYPIDKVKGDGIEEGAGYQGKAPVYYCTEAKSLIPVEYRQSRVAYSMSSNWFNNWCNATNANLQPGYDVTVCNRDYCTAYPQGNCLGECTVETCNSSTIITNGWYASDGILQKLTSIGGGGDPPYDEAEKGIKFYDPSTGQIFDDTFAYCSKVVQTVTSVGDNKYWSSRVYNGSDWKVLPFNYQYTTDGAPFGSIVAPSSNPYDWDGSTADGNQPLLVKRPSSGGARASSPYMIATPAISGGICRTSKNFCATPGVQSTCGSGDICDAGSYYGTCEKTGNLCLHIEGITDTASSTIYELNKADCAPGEGKCQSVDFSGNAINKLKMLFAQSYGAWKWDVSDSRYVVDDASGVNWGLPGKCSNNIRNNPTDFCAVTPSISKIKINGSSADTTLTKNGFVNLTFNTKVDSNQLPLTMYAVDWGDGEKTVVSGAQMRDRPDPPPDNDSNYGNPHSLYHLYSYWDLKAKANQGKLTNGSYCDTAGTCYVKPRVQIKDNWGWYSKGTTINTAPDDWDSFGGYVVVKEK
ncbi:MAG: hypothetical protein Q8O93_00420, partial [bacterium]|nr:hypothetical protein [bacterium]